MYKKNLFLKRLKNLKGKKVYCPTKNFFNNCSSDFLNLNELYKFIGDKTGLLIENNNTVVIDFEKKIIIFCTDYAITLDNKKFLKMELKITSDFNFIIIKKVKICTDNICII